VGSCQWAGYATLPDGTPLRDVGLVATWDDYAERRRAAEDVVRALRATYDGIAAAGPEYEHQVPLESQQVAADALATLQRAESELEALPAGAWAWQGWDLSWGDEIERLAQLAESAACALQHLQDAGFAVEVPSYWDTTRPPPQPAKSVGEGLAEAGRGVGRALFLLGFLWLLGGRK
jgi:hypothetical protein